MPHQIFLVDQHGQLRAMTESRFANEDVFQALLEQHPALLSPAGTPRKCLLIKREVEIADGNGAQGRWAIDHVFVAADGVPTLVEVKRSTDTRIRREVVGQMLDYAANAVLYWPADQLRALFEQRCAASGLDPDQEVLAVLGMPSEDDAIEAFWTLVKTNLEAERVRLVFVADVIPKELQRVVEFLNGQMSPAEVLAIELKPYDGEGLRTLVPRTIGQTSRSERVKPGSAAEPWNEARFFEKLRTDGKESLIPIARDLVDWMAQNGQIRWGRGQKFGDVGLVANAGSLQFEPLTLSTACTLCINVQKVRERDDLRPAAETYHGRIQEITGVTFRPLDEFHFGYVSFEQVLDEKQRRAVKEAVSEYIDDVRRRLQVGEAS